MSSSRVHVDEDPLAASSGSNLSSASSSNNNSNVWPWMSSAKSRLENPIEPLDELDNRPAVEDLVREHREEIDRMKKPLESHPYYNPCKHDDLWILRFLLSHLKHHQQALDAAQHTLDFRHQWRLDDLDLRHIPVKASVLLNSENEPDYPAFAPAAGKMLSCYESETTMVYCLPHAQRGLIGFLHLAGRHQHTMAETLTENDYLKAHLFFTEWKFQWIDYATRTTGRLTKYLSIVDCNGVHRKMIHKESKKLDSKAAKHLENFYPQVLGIMAVCNAPTWFYVVFAIIKPFLPKRLLAKVNLFHVEKERDVNTLLEYVGSLEHLPVKYGGRLDEWPPVTRV